MYTQVNSSVIHNSGNVGATQVSKGKWKDTQNMEYTYNGVLVILKKEWNSDTGYDIGEQRNKPVTKR